MAKQRTFEIDDEKITLRRLTFKEIGELGKAVETLYTMDDPLTLLASDEFKLLADTVAVTAEDREKIDELDLNGIWQLWDDYVEFARFAAFFETAAASQAKRQSALMELQMEHAQAQLDKMKKRGNVPADFSLIDLLQLNQGVPSQASVAGESVPKPRAGKATPKKR